MIEITDTEAKKFAAKYDIIEDAYGQRYFIVGDVLFLIRPQGDVREIINTENIPE